EDAKPSQAITGAVEVVRIIFLPGDDTGLAGDELRVHPLGAAYRNRTERGIATRLHHQRGIDRVGVMGSDDALLSNASLGIALLAPFLHNGSRRAENYAAAGGLSRHKGIAVRVFDTVTAVGREIGRAHV